MSASTSISSRRPVSQSTIAKPGRRRRAGPARANVAAVLLVLALRPSSVRGWLEAAAAPYASRDSPGEEALREDDAPLALGGMTNWAMTALMTLDSPPPSALASRRDGGEGGAPRDPVIPFPSMEPPDETETMARVRVAIEPFTIDLLAIDFPYRLRYRAADDLSGAVVAHASGYLDGSVDAPLLDLGLDCVRRREPRGPEVRWALRCEGAAAFEAEAVSSTGAEEVNAAVQRAFAGTAHGDFLGRVYPGYAIAREREEREVRRGVQRKRQGSRGARKKFKNKMKKKRQEAKINQMNELAERVDIVPRPPQKKGAEKRPNRKKKKNQKKKLKIGLKKQKTDNQNNQARPPTPAIIRPNKRPVVLGRPKPSRPQGPRPPDRPQGPPPSPGRPPSAPSPPMERPSRLIPTRRPSTRRPVRQPTPEPTPAPIPTRRPSTRRPVRQPTSNPTPAPTRETSKPTRKLSPQRTPRPTTNRPRPSPRPPAPAPKPTPPSRTEKQVYSILDSKRDLIDNNIFLYQGMTPSEVYRYEGFISGLRIMVEDGVAGKRYYLGDDSANGHLYGLANIAAFIGQSMKETIQYDACDENNWDFYFDDATSLVVYPLSNACGQLEQSYQDYHCPEHERHMECPVDKDMSLQATTHAKWYGAPGPFFCGPQSEYEEVGHWDYTYACHNPWANPPQTCSIYEGQKAGRYDNTKPVANRNGRTDVEGCCWWGRGVIQTTGICNFGKLNYYLGARAAKDGRGGRYPDIDFCKDPGIICSSEEHQELKWIAGMFYWIESLQSYDERGWNFIDELHKFVDGGMADISFINGVSGVVNRGCHDPPCGTGPVDGAHERAGNFNKVLSLLTS